MIYQPVLQWGPSAAGGGSYWSVASWYVGGQDGVAFHSNLVRVNPGDVLVGVMSQTGQAGSLFSYACDFVDIANTGLSINDVQELTWNIETLEAYGGQQCSDYPNTNFTAFVGIDFQTNAGQPAISWTPVNAVTDCGQNARVVSNANPGGEVDLYYRYPWNGPGDLTTVNNIVSVSGHFGTGDQRHLVVVGTALGRVHEIFWKAAQQGIEGEDDLPVPFDVGTIVSVAALYATDQQRHVVVVGTTAGKVHEIFWKADTVGIEGHDDLPVTFVPGSIVAVSGLYNTDQQRHVVVVGTTAGKVHEIFWKADTVGIEGHDDLPVTFAPGSIVAVSGLYNTDQQRHVVFTASARWLPPC